jgi:hypothetical protein
MQYKQKLNIALKEKFFLCDAMLKLFVWDEV